MKYTIQERREEIDKLYTDFQDEELQERFRQYTKEVSEILGKPEDGHKISYGFNACLRMINTATDIKWSDVKWEGLESSMVSWYSAAVRHDRKHYVNKDQIEKLGWEYSGKTQDLFFKLVKETQPLSLTYRSFRLQYGLDDKRLRITGYEYDNFGPDEEVLFLGKVETVPELKTIMKQIGI